MAQYAQGNAPGRANGAPLWGNLRFYQYYQIGSIHEDDRTEEGPDGSGELKQVGMNSPWGLIFQIISETGLTWHDVLWKVSKLNLMMMMADRPNFIRMKDQPKKISGQALKKMIGYG